MELIIKLTIELVVVVLAYILGRFVIPGLANRIGLDNLEKIKTWATTFVLYVENVITAEKSGTEKFENVYQSLSKKLAEYNIKMSDEDIKAIIEEAVYTMNNTKKDK